MNCGWRSDAGWRRTAGLLAGCGVLALALGSFLALAGCSSGVKVEASTEDSDLFHERPETAPGGQGSAPPNQVRPRVVSAVGPVLPDGYVVTQERFIMVEVLVDEQGGVAQARLLQPSGEEVLDQAALAAARQYRFTAGTVDGIAEPTWTTVPFRFRPEPADRP